MAKKIRKLKMKPGDYILVIMVMALVIFGVIMVFSASYYSAISDYNDPYHYLKSHLVWVAMGLVAMFITASLDYRVYFKFGPWALVISLVLLLALMTPLGVTRNNATRWIGVGSFTVMPGEIAKVLAILFVAWYLSKHPTYIRSLKKGVAPLLLLCGVYFALIIWQPNLSTALTVCGIILGIMFVAGLHWFYVAAIGGVGVLGILALIVTDQDGYRMQRITSFLDPFKDPQGAGWQVIQSLYALGSGGLFGLGLGKSIQKTLYLPEPQNDFIFAIIGEELGYVGCLLLMAAYIVLIWRCVHIALNAPDMFGMLLTSGITIMLALQVIMNIAVVTSSMPATGVILPFVSYGGNALLLFMGSMGIVLNVSRHTAV